MPSWSFESTHVLTPDTAVKFGNELCNYLLCLRDDTNGNLYYVEVADICPQDLDNSIVVEIDGLTVTYAPMDYIVRMYAKGGKSAELVKALYSYYLAAEAYTAA